MIYITDNIWLDTVNGSNKKHVNFLYKLLKDRPFYSNITHKEMPSMIQHSQFINNHPYDDWFIINLKKKSIGSVCITTNLAGKAVGTFFLTKYRGKGYGSLILEWLKRQYNGKRLLANISPDNQRAQKFFMQNGFKLCQFTYEYTGVRNEKK